MNITDQGKQWLQTHSSGGANMVLETDEQWEARVGLEAAKKYRLKTEMEWSMLMEEKKP